MLRERVEGLSSVGNHLTGAGAPSGVLVGVSPVNVPVVGKGVKKSGAANFGLLHVLVVDDDEAVRKACCEITSGMGFALVLGAESATAAREILKHQRIDVLLLDLKLPGGGGLPLLEQVKALHPDTSVIVMTAFATVASAVEAMRIGAGD
jgi:CheY-like chemotaxis protein